MKKKEKTPYKIPTITKTQQKKRLMGDILLITLPCVALLLLLRVFFMIGAVPSRSMYPLMDTGYSMEEIARETGFSSSLNLTRVFKKAYGMAPTQFRKRKESMR